MNSFAYDFTLGCVRVLCYGSIALLISLMVNRLPLSLNIKSWVQRFAYLKAMIIFLTTLTIPLPFIDQVDAITSCADVVTAISISPLFSVVTYSVVAIYFASVLFFVGRIVHGWIEFRSVFRQMRPVEESGFLGRLVKASQNLGVSPPPAVVSNQLNSPLVFGFTRPTLVITSDCLQMSDEEQNSILYHELAHIKNRDLLWNLFGTFVEIVLFFHPLIFLHKGQRKQLQEQCADELALQSKSFDLAVFADVILSFSTNERDRESLYVSMGVHFKDLKNRLSSLKQYRQKSRISLLIERSLLIIIFLAFVVPWSLDSLTLNSSQKAVEPLMSQPKSSPSFIEELIEQSQMKKC